ncbi:MAG: hypothetical protein FJ381_11160 [Verrucomicrobia bacterium]|nr:hypothetical protein [Verrucomicrobiota bacterium]
MVPQRSSPLLGNWIFKGIGSGRGFLRSLGLAKIRLITQHPRKVVGLDGYGVEIVEQLDLSKLA